MIKKGQEIKSKDGETLAIASRNLYVGQHRQHDDFLLPDGSKPSPGTIMPRSLVLALSKLGMEPI